MKWRNHSMGRYYDANEGTVVYFDSHSGDTHLLSDFAGYVMQQLGSRSLSIDELVDLISPNIDSQDITEVREAVTGVLNELLGLDILKQE